ncbi:unnamed protein product [Discosporangium mesarthrocarpum]
MYYVATADRLQRTAPWLEKLPGGKLYYLQVEVVVDDKLGIGEKLEAQMQHLVDTYQDEWATVVGDEGLRKQFKQFVNTDETERAMPFIPQRGQARPMDWPKDEDIPNLHFHCCTPIAQSLPPNLAPSTNICVPKPTDVLSGSTTWVRVGQVDDFPKDGGAAVKYGRSQLAVYRMHGRNVSWWFATQNVCPHKRALVLSQGIVGSKGGIPKVACPLHKKNFDLESGECLDHAGNEDMKLMTFPVKVEGGTVFLDLPPTSELDQLLATEKVMLGSECMTGNAHNFVPFEKSELLTATNATVAA